MNHGPVLHAFETIHLPFIDIGGHHVTLATVIVFALIVSVSYFLSALVQRGVARALSGELHTMHAVARLSHYVIIAVGFSVAMQTAGVDLSAFFAAGAVFAVGVGFAMQSIIQNFVSGLILLIEHSIRPGDILDIEGRQVRVVEMGIRSTRVRSWEDEVLIVPNSILVQTTVRSYTLVDSLCGIKVTVGVAYESDMNRVRLALDRAGRSVSARNAERDPLVLLIDFGASSVNWEVWIWIDDPWNLRPIGSSLREAIWIALLEDGIRIAYPQLDLHLDAKLTDTVADGVDKVVKCVGPRAA